MNILVSSNLFLTILNNPHNLSPEEPIDVFAREGGRYREIFEKALSNSFSNEMKEMKEKADDDNRRIEQLEREILDLNTFIKSQDIAMKNREIQIYNKESNDVVGVNNFNLFVEFEETEEFTWKTRK